MKINTKIILVIFSIFLYSRSSAQIEVAHLKMKDYSATGFGGFLNFAIPVSEGSAVTTEAGFYIFRKDEDNVALIPFLLGYRHTLDRTGAGFYIKNWLVTPLVLLILQNMMSLVMSWWDQTVKCLNERHKELLED